MLKDNPRRGVSLDQVRYKWVLLGIGFAAVWAAFIAWTFSSLTFFWDEWNVLRDTLANPLSSIFLENGGNFFPLSRALFSLELSLFGPWYAGYVFVTAFLFGLTATVLTLGVLKPASRLEFGLAAALSLAYLLTTGVLFASSMGFMNLWPLSVLFALLAAVWLHNAKADSVAVSLASLGLVLSWLSHGTAILSNACLFVAASLVISAREPGDMRRVRRVLLIVTMPAALVAGFSAAFLAQLSSPGNDNSTTLVGGLGSGFETMAEWLVGTVTTLISAPLLLPLMDFTLFTRLYFLFASMPLVTVLCLAATAVLAYVMLRRGYPTVLLLIALLAISVGFLAIVRTPLIVRYEVLWAPIALLIVAQTLRWIAANRLGRAVVTGYVFFALFVVSLGVMSVSEVSNLERQRDLVNTSALWNPETCISEAVKHREEISPSLSPREICQVVETMQER